MLPGIQDSGEKPRTFAPWPCPRCQGGPAVLESLRALWAADCLLMSTVHMGVHLPQNSSPRSSP